jgi:integrase
MKRATLTVRPYPHSKTHRFYLNLRPFGQGRKFFRTRAEAEAARLRHLTALERHGREAIGLPQHELSDFIRARKTLADYGKTINDATAFYVDHLERVRRCKTTIGQLADEVLEAKRKDGRAPRYIESLRHYLSKFSREFGERPIAAITVEELDNWLRDLPYSPKSRANFRANIGVLFSYATKRRMLDFNPITHTAKPKLPDNPPEIFRVDELSALLDAANRLSPDLVPALAIGAFAGLRDSEIKRLTWSELDLARGHIEVKAAKAKSARRRIVPIAPNLAAWLRPYAGMKGGLVSVGARRKLGRVRKAAGLTRWPKNGLRHSFASYRLAAINDGPRVAAELGHTTPQLLYSTYRELVLPEEAKRYWLISAIAGAINVIPLRQTGVA